MSAPCRWLWVILAAALVLRCGLAVGLQRWLDGQPGRDFLIAGDADGYWELGRRIAGGQPYELSPQRRVLRMPGFPAFLAAAMKLHLPWDDDFLTARLMSALVGTAACGVVYLLGRELTEEPVAVTAAALAAISPTLAGFSVVLLSETLFAAALLLNLWLFAKLIQPRAVRPLSPQAMIAIGCGLAAAAATYVRPSWLPFTPLLAGFLIVSSKFHSKAIMVGILMTVALLAALAPWAVRNHRVTGHYVFTTLWLGPSLYDGLNPQATGDSDMTFIEVDTPRLREMTEYEIDRDYRRRAWEFVRDNPGRVLQLAGAKFLRFWNVWPNAPQFDRWCLKVVMLVYFLPVLACAILGVWATREVGWFIALTAGPILFFTALHLIFVASLRYRLPAEYPLCIAAAAGMHLLYRRWRDRPMDLDS